MKSIRLLALLAVLGGLLAASTSSVRAAAPSTPLDLPKTEHPAPGEKSEKPEKPEKPGVGTKPDDVGPGRAASDEVKTARAQFKQEQKELLEKYKELIKSARNVSQDEVDKVREQFKAAREELQAKQKELRDEMKAKLEEFKKAHSEQEGVVDAAKEAKDKARRRRGNG